MRRILYSLLILLFLPVNCVKNQAAPVNDYYDQLAKFLAGRGAVQTSQFSKLTSGRIYQDYAARMNEFWERVKKNNIEKIIPWRDKHIPLNRGTAFYPLSGADIVNLYTFYPAAKNYIMIAMEETGKIPDPFALKDAELAEGLNALHRGVWTIGSENYFTTSGMNIEFKNRYLKGVVPVLLIFLSRMEHRILSVDLIRLNENGLPVKVAEIPADDNPADYLVHGCRINFLDAADGTERSLTYLSVKLEADSHLPVNPVGKFLAGVDGTSTLIKSAVYILHWEKYKSMAELILSKSKTLVEDDSGIPYRYFDSSRWDVRLFGYYKYPKKLKDLKNPPHQPDLEAAYNRQAFALGFNFGYGVLLGKEKSNLLLAVKKGK